VGGGSPDPAPSPTAGLPIDQNATNEATDHPFKGLGIPDHAREDVGRESPDPAPSPTAGLPIHQNATNEATAPPLVGPETPDQAPSLEVGLTPTAGLLIPENATNEATNPPVVRIGTVAPNPTEGLSPVSTDHEPLTTDHSPITNKTNEPNRLSRVVVRSLQALLVAALTRLTLVLFFGLAAASAAKIGSERPSPAHFVERPIAHGDWRVTTMHTSLLDAIGRPRAG
jgi:hypothetical protein